jgi:hypothetical protein
MVGKMLGDIGKARKNKLRERRAKNKKQECQNG